MSESSSAASTASGGQGASGASSGASERPGASGASSRPGASGAGPLGRLLAVQDLDTRIDQARHRRDHLPERAELLDLDRRGLRLNGELAAAAAASAEVAARQAAAEAELAATEERVAGIDKRLYSGEVSATRDLQAMAAEAEHLRTRASALEDEVLGRLEEREPFESSAAALRQELSALAESRAVVAARLGAAEEAVEGELADLVSQRSDAVADVPADLLDRYEKLRARLGGVGVARVVGNHCDGCHLTLSAMELDRVRHLPEGEVFTCEQCSRILVP